MKAHLIGMTALATALVGGQAQAAPDACTLTGLNAPSFSATYDPFDDSFSPLQVTVNGFTHGDCNAAKVQLAITPSPNEVQGVGTQVKLRQGSSVLLGTIQANGPLNQIVNAPATFSSSPPAFALGSGNNLGGGFEINLALNQIVPPGNYRATLLLVARVTNKKEPIIQKDVPLNLNVNVQPSVRLATGSGTLSIDIGELTKGATGGPVNFDAYANVNYNLVITSENDFYLLRRNGKGHDDGVPYQPTLRGKSSVEGRNGDSDGKTIRFTMSGDGIRHHALSVKVGEVANLPAGIYSDIMTVKISATL